MHSHDQAVYEMSNNSDTEEEKPSPKKSLLSVISAEKIEKSNNTAAVGFLRSIQPALDNMQKSGKPLQYFKAKNLIIRLASFVPEQFQQAVVDEYDLQLKTSGHSVELLKKFISDLECLIIAAHTTETERLAWFEKISKCINTMKAFEKVNRQYMLSPQGKVHNAQLMHLQSQIVSNSTLEEWHDALQCELEKIKQFFTMRQLLDKHLEEMESKPCYKDLLKLLDEEFGENVPFFVFTPGVFEIMQKMYASLTERKKAHLLKNYAEQFEDLPENSSVDKLSVDELENRLDSQQPGLVFVPVLPEGEEDFELAASRDSNLSPQSSMSPRSPSSLEHLSVFARSLREKYQASQITATPITPSSPRLGMRSASDSSGN